VRQQGTTTAAPERPLRADAARNRDKILVAAGAVFTEQGTDASLEEVARRAEVGVGTLYRHFPTRIDLIEAVYRHDVDELCAEAARLRDGDLPAREALETWVLSFVQYVGRKRGMASALRSALGPDAQAVFADVHDRLRAASGELLAAAQREGEIRTDVEPMDVLRAVSGVCLAAAEAQDPERSMRVLRLVLDGLRYGT
jgi:AcrR family transcriptional regulator